MTKKIARMHFIRHYILTPVLVLFIALGIYNVAHAVTNSNIDPEARWAWSTNVGWINFNPGVTTNSHKTKRDLC